MDFQYSPYDDPNISGWYPPNVGYVPVESMFSSHDERQLGLPHIPGLSGLLGLPGVSGATPGHPQGMGASGTPTSQLPGQIGGGGFPGQSLPATLGQGAQQTGPPSSPPPQFTPPMPQQQGISVFAMDPGAIRGCLFRFTYVWLNDGNQFWFYPVFVGRNSVAGWRWSRFRWVYFGIDLQRVSSFRCF